MHVAQHSNLSLELPRKDLYQNTTKKLSELLDSKWTQGNIWPIKSFSISFQPYSPNSPKLRIASKPFSIFIYWFQNF